MDCELSIALRNADYEKWNEIRKEQKKLGVFLPIMTHSFFEGAPNVVFHKSLLSHFDVVYELCITLLHEIEREDPARTGEQALE